jgi:hypothetical protein
MAMSAARVCAGAVALLGLLHGLPAGASDGPDMLFNCVLAGAKRPMTFEAARGILWDAGLQYDAKISADAVEGQYLHDWSTDTRMRHRIRIGCHDGSLIMEVDEIDAGGRVINDVLRESGKCSPEKIHPRNFPDVPGETR